MRQQPEVVLGAPHIGDCERSFPARLDRALCFRNRALRVEVGVINAGCLVDDHLPPLVRYPMPTVGCRGIEVENEWWIHLARHAAAVFWFNGNEQVAEQKRRERRDRRFGGFHSHFRAQSSVWAKASRRRGRARRTLLPNTLRPQRV